MSRLDCWEPEELLLYYFRQAGVNVSGDVEVEIRAIARGIVETAVEEAREQILDEIYNNIFCAGCGAFLGREQAQGNGLCERCEAEEVC